MHHTWRWLVHNWFRTSGDKKDYFRHRELTNCSLNEFKSYAFPHLVYRINCTHMWTHTHRVFILDLVILLPNPVWVITLSKWLPCSLTNMKASAGSGELALWLLLLFIYSDVQSPWTLCVSVFQYASVSLCMCAYTLCVSVCPSVGLINPPGVCDTLEMALLQNR